jgi:hypothetical protein
LAIQHKDQNSSTAKQAKDAKTPFSSRRIFAKADLSRHCFNKGGSRLAERRRKPFSAPSPAGELGLVTPKLGDGG